MTYRVGSKGAVVKQIQQALRLYPDGIFGQVTEEAVKDYQRENGLTVDGIVGPATLTKLLSGKLKGPFTKKKSKRRIDEIIIHCTATPEGKDYTVDDIRRWHKQQGWSDIGYHYVIYRDSTVAIGRDVDLVGAHCQGHNAHSIGICYVGGVDVNGRASKDTRTDLQKAALLSLLVDLRKIYPYAKIYGHRDFDARKACPSFDAQYEYRHV